MRIKKQLNKAYSYCLISCFFSCLVGLIVLEVRHLNGSISSQAISFIRVLSSVFLIVVSTDLKNLRQLFQIRDHKKIWAWGIFGSLTVTSYFASMTYVGPSRAILLSSSSGIFALLLHLVFLKNQVKLKTIIPLLGSVLGLIFIFSGQHSTENFIGNLLGLFCGFSTAMAYHFISSTKTRYDSGTIMFVWFFVSTLVHLFWITGAPGVWPDSVSLWSLLCLSGLVASGAQYFLTKAYQLGDSIEVNQLSYLAPVLMFFSECLFFKTLFGFYEVLGFGLVLLCAYLVIQKPEPVLNSLDKIGPSELL